MFSPYELIFFLTNAGAQQESVKISKCFCLGLVTIWTNFKNKIYNYGEISFSYDT